MALKEEDNVLVGKPTPLPLCPPQLPQLANFDFSSQRSVTYSMRSGTAYTHNYIHDSRNTLAVTVTPYVYILLIKYVITFY